MAVIIKHAGGPQAFKAFLSAGDGAGLVAALREERRARAMTVAPTYGFGRKNLISSIGGVRRADYIMQGHAYLWRRTPVTAAIIFEIQALIATGFINDNAVASIMSRRPRDFFLLNPPLLVQSATFS